MRSSLDVLVVGGGPAGSTAATMLALAGARVRLVERARFPRHKLCGDTLNPGALAVLEGLDQDGSAAPVCGCLRARGRPIGGMTVSGPGGAVVSAAYPAGVQGISISRAEFDALLLERAAVSGVDVIEGARALTPLLHDGRVVGARVSAGREADWPARVVIVADGRGSRLAAALRLSSFARRPRRWAFGAYFSDVEGMTERGEMHVRRDGYVGVSPLPDGLVNVCVVRHARGSQDPTIDQRRVLAETLSGDPSLRERFAAARQQTPVTALGPLAIDASAAGVPGALLAGDAAGFVDPITGDGLRFALHGAVLAARAALVELETARPAFAWLDRERHRAFAGKWYFNRGLRTLIDSPAALHLAARMSRRWAAPMRLVIRTAGDVGRSAGLPGVRRATAADAPSGAW